MIAAMPVLLGRVRALLEGSAIVQEIILVETREFSSAQYFFKLRATLTGDHQLQVRLYVNGVHVDYAYQLFSDEPVIRWDNKEEYPALSTFPHHFHTADGHVIVSELTGDPLSDLPVVLSALEHFLAI